MNGFPGDVRELLEILVGLASRAGWKGIAKVTKDGDDFLIALRVRRLPVELSEWELRRRVPNLSRKNKNG
jgi:hypothetical protein